MARNKQSDVVKQVMSSDLGKDREEEEEEVFRELFGIFCVLFAPLVLDDDSASLLLPRAEETFAETAA
jgi:hypothetical protein